MFEKFVDQKIATDPGGLKKYLTGFSVLFLLLLLPSAFIFDFELLPVLLTILFYGIPFILCQYFMYAMVFWMMKRKVLFMFSVVGLSVFIFELYSMVFYNEPCLIHDIRANRFPVFSMINVLASIISCQWAALKDSANEKV